MRVFNSRFALTLIGLLSLSAPALAGVFNFAAATFEGMTVVGSVTQYVYTDGDMTAYINNQTPTAENCPIVPTTCLENQGQGTLIAFELTHGGDFRLNSFFYAGGPTVSMFDAVAPGGSYPAEITLGNLFNGALEFLSAGVSNPFPVVPAIIPTAFDDIAAVYWMSGCCFPFTDEGGVAFINYTPLSSIPEPETLAILGSSVACIRIFRRRNRYVT
jgi:hypothetical protein